MYAVIETGGKQFRVELGSEIEVDRLDVQPGETIELGRVLLLADGDETQVGQPVVEGARVSASVVRQDRGDKVVVFKYRPKARRRVKHGHRQDLTVVRVADIEFNGRSVAREVESANRQREAERQAAEEEAGRKAAADRALAEKLAREQVAASAATEPKQGRTGRARRAAADRTAAPSDEPAADKSGEGQAEHAADQPAEQKSSRRRAARAKAEATDERAVARKTSADDDAARADSAEATESRPESEAQADDRAQKEE